MKIAISNPGLYFVMFYLLSFAVILTWVIVFSLRRGYPLRSVLLMLTTIALFTIIGSRLFTIPINEWGRLIGSGSTPEFNNRSAVGGGIVWYSRIVICTEVFRFWPSHPRPVCLDYANRPWNLESRLFC